MYFISTLTAEAPSILVGGRAVQSWLDMIGGISGDHVSRFSKSIAL